MYISIIYMIQIFIHNKVRKKAGCNLKRDYAEVAIGWYEITIVNFVFHFFYRNS